MASSGSVQSVGCHGLACGAGYVRQDIDSHGRQVTRQTPPIPDTCQWAVFLRNHDELTLEMLVRHQNWRIEQARRDNLCNVFRANP
jgi:hypothetical protein